MQPVNALLVKAFTDAGFSSPKKETVFLLLIIEMLWKELSSDEQKRAEDLKDFIKEKYAIPQ
jgi:hypothetical protein